VKLQAAAYADGSTSGSPEKIKQLVEHRRAKLAAYREIVQRIGKAKAAAAADLKQWRDSLPDPGKLSRYEADGLQRAAVKSLIGAAIADLESFSPDAELSRYRSMADSLAGTKQ
jgi:hypothetical protein